MEAEFDTDFVASDGVSSSAFLRRSRKVNPWRNVSENEAIGTVKPETETDRDFVTSEERSSGAQPVSVSNNFPRTHSQENEADGTFKRETKMNRNFAVSDEESSGTLVLNSSEVSLGRNLKNDEAEGTVKLKDNGANGTVKLKDNEACGTVKPETERDRNASNIMIGKIEVGFNEVQNDEEKLDGEGLETEQSRETAVEQTVRIENKEFLDGGSIAYSLNMGPSKESAVVTDMLVDSTHPKAPLQPSVYYVEDKGSETNVILNRGNECIDSKSKETEFVMSKMVLQAMTDMEKNQKWPTAEGNWKSNYMDSETSTEAYINQSFVTGKFNTIEKTENGKGAFLDTCTFSVIGSIATRTGRNRELTTNEAQEKTENAGVKEHQHGNSASEIVLQNSQERYVRAQDEQQLKEHWTRILEKSALDGKVEDIVNILKDQQSHDLICPICDSCITKRVILRKRKRVSLASDDRLHQEANDDVKDAVSEEEHEITEDQNVRPEISNENDEETEAYGCLACFSIILRRVAGFKIVRPISESGNNSLADQYPTEMHQDSRIMVDKENDGFYCLPFLYPWGDSVNKESKPVAVEEFTSCLPNQRADHPDITIQNTSSQTSTTKTSTLIYSRSMKNVEIRETNYTTTETTKSTKEEHTMPPSSSKPTIDGQFGCAESKFEVPNESGPGQESDMHGQHLDKIAESKYLEKQHQYQNDMKGTRYQPTKLHFNSSAAVSVEHRKVKTEQLGVNTSTKPVDMFRREVETTMDENMIRSHLATQEQASNDLSVAARPDNVEEHMAVRQGQSDKKDYLGSCIPVSIPAVWRIWSSKESTADPQLTEPLLAIKDKETFDKIPVALQDDQQREIISPLKSDSVESSIPSETRDPTFFVKHKVDDSVSHSKVDDSVSQSSEISPDSGKTVPSTAGTVATVIDIGQTDDPQPSITDMAVSELAKTPSTQVQDLNVVPDWDILKSIVYGGFTVSITSLGVVSSAAGGEAKTLTVIAIGLSNLVAGLFLIFNNILYLDHFHQDEFIGTVGHRFWFNGFVAILSYLIFGSLAPITYSFSFQKSDDRVYKFLATSLVSLLSIILLALGKARVTQKSYIRIVILYIVTGFWASIIGFFAGEYIKKLLEKWGFTTD